VDSSRRPRWTDENRDDLCDVCLYLLDDCHCVCPFCKQTAGCECTIGLDVATGG